MKRSLTHRLRKWKDSDNRKPLILKGARQVGKTWLLTDFGNQEFTKVHYINLEKEKRFHSIFKESLNPLTIISTLEIMLAVKIDTRNDFLIFDEIQECPEALTSLKYFNEELPFLAVGCAGSHMGIMLSMASFPIGKVDFLALYPLSFKEFLNAKHPDLIPFLKESSELKRIPEAVHNLLWEEFKNYYLVGGMPEAVETFINNGGNGYEAYEAVRSIHRKLIEGIQSDFAKHSGKWNATHIARIWEDIPHQISRVNNNSVSRFQFKGVIPNKSKFSQFEGPIDWLVNTGLAIPVYMVEQPAVPIKSRAKKNMVKLYLFDIGLMGTMSEIPIESILRQDYGSYKGYIAENYVAQELNSKGHQLFFWQGRTSEIEFLITAGDQIVPIEVKSGNRTRARSLEVYQKQYSPIISMVISSKRLSNTAGRLYLPLYNAGNAREIISSIISAPQHYLHIEESL
ncbi:MAG: AAA family ATPase [Spirochaetes bacterium]|nr:MAG: AAA family ATPase [Spirochaetota bacterium]